MRTLIKTNSTSQFQKTNSYQDTSPLWGIGEGKRKARIEAAKADRFLKEEEARRLTLIATGTTSAASYNPEAIAATQNIQPGETKQTGDKTLYIILGFVVLAVMAGLYFIKKR